MLVTKAARALRHLGDDVAADDALTTIAYGLDSPSVIDRRTTVRQIGQICGEAAIPFLQEAMQDPEAVVRREAGAALREVTESLQE